MIWFGMLFLKTVPLCVYITVTHSCKSSYNVFRKILWNFVVNLWIFYSVSCVEVVNVGNETAKGRTTGNACRKMKICREHSGDEMVVGFVTRIRKPLGVACESGRVKDLRRASAPRPATDL